MTVLGLLMIAVCAAGTLCAGTLNGASLDINLYKDLLLDLHNRYRRQVQPPAANMQVMVWNQNLSTEAASWIEGCDFKHQHEDRGENLAFNTNAYTTEKLIADALKSWYDEKNQYSLGPQSCGGACHYTQMVWHKTTQVGCAMVQCQSLTAFGRRFKNAWYLGCFYDPKGNWIGETPYDQGAPCSQCLTGQTCDKKLCTGNGVNNVKCEDKKDKCETWEAMGECSKNPDYMRRNCRKACGECRVTEESTVCRDNDGRCGTWARGGECENNKEWMLPNCRKSCKGCTGGNGESGNDNGSGSGSGNGRDGVDGLACHNEFPQRSCRVWSLSGACNRHPEYMSLKCRRECGLCRDNGNVCRNKLRCCADMKRRGYCRQYRKFMRDNCPASCSRC
ncbi:cysteine-rich venom protein pseudechetoxin-like [Pecten maximus]|uniref:cysteine-rich venom protein pseudechetoxin-like n=1 Tax=Pecten maximus TaxID=6579 RepID=UPI001458E345|nr:cysteine-rich venom protein pseudechetoxin-like [Pecten maximus]